MKNNKNKYSLTNLKLGNNSIGLGVCKGLSNYFDFSHSTFQVLFIIFWVKGAGFLYFIMFFFLLINNAVQKNLEFKKKKKLDKQDSSYSTFKKI